PTPIAHHRRIRDGGGGAVPCNRPRTSLGRSRLRLAWGLHSALATEGSLMPMIQAASTPRPRKLEPELFGPLDGTPAIVTKIPDLFAGDEKFLGKSARKKRVALWQAVAPVLDGMLGPDERILHAAPAMQKPTSLQVIGLGHWAPYFHRVLLVFTDARLVEILLDFRGTSPETRIRSFAWPNVRDVRLRLLGLTLLPANGKKHRWNVTVRGDRKLLKLLLPRMRNHLRWETASRPGAVPASHCPTCYGVLAE